jgi:hypothetical protein
MENNLVREIEPKEAKSLVDKLGPHIKYDFTYDPIYPTTRKDVCAIRRLAENGSSYGFDTIYLIWKSKGELKNKHLIDSESTKDYINIDEVIEDKNHIIVKLSSGGSFSGYPWKRDCIIKKSELNLE